MRRSLRRYLHDILYVVVIIEVLLVVFILPIALVNNRSRTVTNANRARTHGLRDNGSRVDGIIDESSLKESPKKASGDLTSEMLHMSSLLRMQTLNVSEDRNLLSCREIEGIALDHPIGKGTTKYVYQSTVNGQPVAVKLVTSKVTDITACKRRKGKEHTASCFQFANYKVLKEIALLQQLRHPNIAKLLGYCIRNEEPGKETVRMVMEFGNPVDIRTLKWSIKLKIAEDLAELLHYLNRSPIGPIRIGDFKRDQFRLVNNSLKLSDLDDLTTSELSCTDERNCYILGKDQGVQCVKSVCENFNTVANIKVAKTRFFDSLLKGAPPVVQDECMKLLGALSSGIMDTEDLRNRIILIRKHYREGSSR